MTDEMQNPACLRAMRRCLRYSGPWQFAAAIPLLVLLVTTPRTVEAQASGLLHAAARVVSAGASWEVMGEVEIVLRHGLDGSRRRPMTDGRLGVVNRFQAGPHRKEPAGTVVYTINFFAN